MYISKNWLSKYIKFPNDLSPEIIKQQISQKTAEVENVIIQGENLKNVIVGQIQKIQDHPDADKLKVCQVLVGKNKLVQIVCGGENLEKNMFVAVALPGAYVKWHGKGEPVRLEKAVIRGQESFGMICAGNEIGLDFLQEDFGDRSILDLGKLNLENLEVGQELSKALGLTDIIFEIENKTLSNRPDLWGHYGFARELSVIFDLELLPTGIKEFEVGTQPFEVVVEDFEDCPRYIGLVVENIEVQESPKWLKDFLNSVGLRPINNIVDITNYVMYDLGQPMHAFDFDKIEGKIFVRRGKQNEYLKLLNESEIKLNKEFLIISDEIKPLALAGVMGGSNSEVTDKTTKIFLECANFRPDLIRKMANLAGVRTDSSNRFEKSLDPFLPELAIKRAVNLIQEIIPQAKVRSILIDEYKELPKSREILLEFSKLYKLLGFDSIDKNFIKHTLIKLGFIVKDEEKDKINLIVPSWRATKDITTQEDVIEEIIRIYGYDKVPVKAPLSKLEIPKQNKFHKVEKIVKDFCSLHLGMNEIYTYSFVSKEMVEKSGLKSDNYFELENPIAKDIPLLRQSLIPSLLQAVEKNLKFYKSFALFEVGRVFLSKPGEFDAGPKEKQNLPSQPYQLSGAFIPEDYDKPFYDARNAVMKLLDFLNIQYRFERADKDNLFSWMHPFRSLQIEVLNELLGVVSELHPKIADNWKIKKRVGLFLLDFDLLVNLASTVRKFKEIPKYPSISLDVSMIVDYKVEWENIKNLILQMEKNLIETVYLFDEFQNDFLKQNNKKSLAFRIIYQSKEKTLEQDEVLLIHAGILNELEKVFKAEIRR